MWTLNDYERKRVANSQQAVIIGLWRYSGRTGGDRTRDPNIKSVVLYQLSYSPRSKVVDYTIISRWLVSFSYFLSIFILVIFALVDDEAFMI